MNKVKKIINCETNKKYIIVENSGYIRIPDVIIYLLLDDGSMQVAGCDMQEDLPRVGESWTKDNALLLGWLDKKHFARFIECLQEDVDDKQDSMEQALAFLEKARRITPYLNIMEDVEGFHPGILDALPQDL